MNINAIFNEKNLKKRIQKVKEITFKQYKAIDVSLLTVLLFIFEALATYASTHWFSLQALALSVTPLMLSLIMIRWGWPAVISAVAAGVAYCVAGGGTATQYVIYCVGNAFALLSLLVIKAFGKDEIRKNKFKLTVYTVSTYLFICIGRWLVSLAFEPTIKTLLVFITTDIISLVIALVGVFALRNNDGMLEDQKTYLLRLDRERKEEQNAQMNPAPYLSDYDEDDDFDDGYIDGEENDGFYEDGTDGREYAPELDCGTGYDETTDPDGEESEPRDGQNEKNI